MSSRQHRLVRGPRLYHTKSRTGCSRCRARRVKCDESRPVCNNCHRHKVACEYDRGQSHGAQPPREQLPLPASSPDSSNSQTSGPPSLAAPIFSPPYWELRALHHFTVVTSHSLPGSHIASVQECWAVHVPRLALEYEPLLNTLLALSASHLVSAGCSDAGLLGCRARYLDAALRAHREALGSSLSATTAEAACFTSILLLVDTFATLRERLVSPYRPPTQWLRIVRGARTVFEAAWDLISSDPASPIMALVRSSAAFTDPPTVSSSEADLGSFSYLLPDDGPDTVHVYRETVGYIRSMHAAVESAEHPLALCRRLVTFACLVPERFLDLVEGRRPRALATLAHLFALSAPARDIWWIGQTPFREVYAIRDHVPTPLRHLLDFPLQTLDDSQEAQPRI